MGYASLIEDIIKRFDAEFSFAPSLRDSKPPRPAAVAERLRLDREMQANEIAIREYQKNQRKLKAQLKTIAHLKSQITQTNRELHRLRTNSAALLQANKALERDLARYRKKYALRAHSQLSQASIPHEQSLSPLLAKIENMKESDLAALNKESRERLDNLKAYASSERRVQAHAAEIETLSQALAKNNQELHTLSDFLRDVERQNRSLSLESKTFQGWDTMTEWLDKNPKFTPKELPPPAIAKPFNPIFPDPTDPTD